MVTFDSAFSIARLPNIEFGAGSVRQLPALVSRLSRGRRALLVTGTVGSN